MQKICALFLATLVSFYGCGGGSPVGDLNSSTDDLTTAAKDFVDKEQAFLNYDPSGDEGNDLMVPLDEYIDAAENFKNALEKFNTAQESFLSELGSSSSNRLSPIAQGSAGPDLALQVGQLIEQGNLKGKECKQLVDAELYDEARECINKAKTSLTASAFNTGVSAVVGGGAAAVTGLAIAAAPVTVGVVAATGVSLAVGAVVGFAWSWCTSSSNRLVAQSGSEEYPTCAFAARQTPLQGSETKLIASTSLPQGTGTITITVPGHAPIVRTVTVGPAGLHVSVNLAGEDAPFDEIGDAIDDSTTEEGPQTPEGVTCADISFIDAVPDPLDPTPEDFVTVTVTVFPILRDCTVKYEVSGTDTYSDKDSLTTNNIGQVNFGIPPGAQSVVDTVTASSGSATTVITYTF